MALRKTDLALCAAGRPRSRTQMRLIYKWRGESVTEALPTPAAVRKAEQEIAEFRHY